MKPTQEQVIAWAREAGFCDASQIELNVEWTCVFSELRDAYIAAYEAGRKDENEACAKEVDRWIGCDSLAAAIRARREQ